MKSKRSFYTGWFICLSFCCAAIALLFMGYIKYGLTVFCVFPVILGVATGIIPDSKGAVMGLMVGLISFFILLLVGGYEGVLCIVAATPIITVLVFIGFLISYLVKRYNKNKSPKSYASVVPFLFFLAAGGIEGYLNHESVRESITTSVTVPFSTAMVYDNIIDVDTVKAEQSTLHYLGLPLPLGCTLTEEKIGGLRICNFKNGRIVETITAFKRGEYLNMDVTEFNLKGRPWIKFEKDNYTMEKVKNGTKISRTTTYYSELKPRFYWSRIEAFTIAKEQDFVFRNLLIDLNEDQQ